MNNVQRDKCYARRIKRAGNVYALLIMRASHDLEAVRPRSNDERRGLWGNRYYNSTGHHRDHAIPSPVRQPSAPHRATPVAVQVRNPDACPGDGSRRPFLDQEDFA